MQYIIFTTGSRTSHYQNFTLLCETTGDDSEVCGLTAGGVHLHNMQYSKFPKVGGNKQKPKASVTKEPANIH